MSRTTRKKKYGSYCKLWEVNCSYCQTGIYARPARRKERHDNKPQPMTFDQALYELGEDLP